MFPPMLRFSLCGSTGNRTPDAVATGLQPVERPSLTTPKMAGLPGIEPGHLDS